VPQIRPLADTVHSKYCFTYLLTYLLIESSVVSGASFFDRPPSSNCGTQWRSGRPELILICNGEKNYSAMSLVTAYQLHSASGGTAGEREAFLPVLVLASPLVHRHLLSITDCACISGSAPHLHQGSVLDPVGHSSRKRVKQSKKRKKSRFLDLKKRKTRKKNVTVITCTVGLKF